MFASGSSKQNTQRQFKQNKLPLIAAHFMFLMLCRLLWSYRIRQQLWKIQIASDVVAFFVACIGLLYRHFVKHETALCAHLGQHTIHMPPHRFAHSHFVLLASIEREILRARYSSLGQLVAQVFLIAFFLSYSSFSLLWIYSHIEKKPEWKYRQYRESKKET